jgi:hypothetical protein
MYVTLEEAKSFLDVQIADDDAVISLCVGAAEQTVANFLNAPLADFATKEDSSDVDSPTLPDAIKLGILMYTADAYEHRTVMSEQTLQENPLVTRVLHFYRRCLGV